MLSDPTTVVPLRQVYADPTVELPKVTDSPGHNIASGAPIGVMVTEGVDVTFTLKTAPTALFEQDPNVTCVI